MISMQHTHRLHTAPGQALLVSVLVLGSLTLGFILVGLTSIIDEMQSNTALENKAIAAAAATACMEQAMDRLGMNTSYTGNETLTVATQTCRVQPVIVGSGIWTLQTSATSTDQVARYQVVLTSRSPVVIGSWDER